MTEPQRQEPLNEEDIWVFLLVWTKDSEVGGSTRLLPKWSFFLERGAGEFLLLGLKTAIWKRSLPPFYVPHHASKTF